MKFNKQGCVSFLIGFFILGKVFNALYTGELDEIVLTILGILLAIGFGLMVGEKE